VPDYQGMVDGLVWPDELPDTSLPNRSEFLRVFCVLVHLRTSIIVRAQISAEAQVLLDELRLSCPDWSFSAEDRFRVEHLANYERCRRRFFRELDVACRRWQKV